MICVRDVGNATFAEFNFPIRFYFSVFAETSHILSADSVCPLYLNILK